MFNHCDSPVDMPIIVSIISLGCAKNLVDTEVMCGALVSNGCLLAEDENDANVILINTCSFILDARKEAQEAIANALKWKRRARKTRRMVVVAGCLVQRNPQETKEKFPDVDLFIGLDDVPNAAKLIIDAYNKPGVTPPLPTGGLPTYLYDHNAPRLTVTPEAFAYVKIAEGCDHRCAFCAIPTFRGRQRSRQPDSVVEECKQLLAQGVKEINFIAQDSSRYGTDHNNGNCLAKLLQACDKIDGDFWLRVLYTHPLYVTDELFQTLAHSRHVVPYLDMPIQHIATPVLQAMRRGMTGQQTIDLLNHIRRDFPELIIRTTVLVGFPGETEQDFQKLLDFVKSFKFNRLGAFSFSPEVNTPAADMKEGLVPHAVAEKRKKQILEAQQEISIGLNNSLVGKDLHVLLEQQESGKSWIARSTADAPDVDDVIHVTVKDARRKSPRFANVRIVKADAYECEANEI
ncbi:MAG: 30S ribosomal protein S12 methylthiotransferase RimO [Victivallales bacterium]|nr:30S ribosomal protein S12 methylthiotransferase RimO [Victivallales bacterium]